MRDGDRPLDPQRGTSAARTRRWRDRRRRGFRVAVIEVCAADIDALVKRGFVERLDRHNNDAVEAGIGKLLDSLIGR